MLVNERKNTAKQVNGTITFVDAGVANYLENPPENCLKKHFLFKVPT